MNILNRLSLGFIISATLIFLIEKVSSQGISSGLAKRACGASYLQEPDQALAQQGVLTESACGFDADMYLVALVVTLLLTGILLRVLFRVLSRKR